MALKSQRDQRREYQPLDQFGRKWGLVIEITTSEPTGEINTCGWHDPLEHSWRYLRVVREGGEVAWGKVRIDFERWIKQTVNDERDWNRSVLSIGKMRYKEAFDPTKAMRDPYLLEQAGPKPWPSSKALKKAQAGDKALLGLAPLTEDTRKLLDRPDVDALLAEAMDEEEVVKPSHRKQPVGA